MIKHISEILPEVLNNIKIIKMNNENIIDGNKHIALYMGAEFKSREGMFGEPNPVETYKFTVNPNHRCGIGTERQAWELEYHSCWEWLMVVVERIEGNGFTFSITNRIASISDKNGHVHNAASNFPTKIETVWTAVAGFAKWHNLMVKAA